VGWLERVVDDAVMQGGVGRRGGDGRRGGTSATRWRGGDAWLQRAARKKEIERRKRECATRYFARARCQYLWRMPSTVDSARPEARCQDL
jgi:hypothetical protein